MGDHIHSTGRGGAGNIGEDKSTYIDGDIVREGIEGESNRPEYSAGRGGAGNMVHTPRSGTPAAGTPHSKPAGPPPGGEDIIPESATRGHEGQENFHTGRGGEGNIHREKFGGHSKAQGERHEGEHESLGDKVKHALGMDKHKEKEGSGLKNETT